MLSSLSEIHYLTNTAVWCSLNWNAEVITSRHVQMWYQLRCLDVFHRTSRAMSPIKMRKWYDGPRRVNERDAGNGAAQKRVNKICSLWPSGALSDELYWAQPEPWDTAVFKWNLIMFPYQFRPRPPRLCTHTYTDAHTHAHTNMHIGHGKQLFCVKVLVCCYDVGRE